MFSDYQVRSNWDEEEEMREFGVKPGESDPVTMLGTVILIAVFMGVALELWLLS